MDNIPPFPKGQKPPVPLAKFQNNVNKIENQLYDSVGYNNDRVFPKISKRGRSLAMMQQIEEGKLLFSYFIFVKINYYRQTNCY